MVKDTPTPTPETAESAAVTALKASGGNKANACRLLIEQVRADSALRAQVLGAVAEADWAGTLARLADLRRALADAESGRERTVIEARIEKVTAALATDILAGACWEVVVAVAAVAGGGPLGLTSAGIGKPDGAALVGDLGTP